MWILLKVLLFCRILVEYLGHDGDDVELLLDLGLGEAEDPLRPLLGEPSPSPSCSVRSEIICAAFQHRFYREFVGLNKRTRRAVAAGGPPCFSHGHHRMVQLSPRPICPEIDPQVVRR